MVLVILLITMMTKFTAQSLSHKLDPQASIREITMDSLNGSKRLGNQRKS
jgi:hypothetical protein